MEVTVARHDGSPPEAGYVELHTPGDAAPIAGCQLRGSSRCSLTTERLGFARLRLGAVDHMPHEVAIVLGPQPVELTARLGTAAVDPRDPLSVRLEGSWQAQPLERGDDGMLRATLKADGPVRYRVFGIATQAEVNARNGELVRGDDGGYWSVAAPTGGRVAIVVDPHALPPPKRRPKIEFSPRDSVSAQVDGLVKDVEDQRREYFQALKAAGVGGAGEVNASDLGVARRRLIRVANTTKSPTVRNAARVAVLALAAFGPSDGPMAHTQSQRALGEIDPTDGLWSIDPAALVVALGAAGTTAAALEYAKAVVARHPDTHVVGAVLVRRLRRASEAGDTALARATYRSLLLPRFDGSAARSLAKMLDPDRPVQPGRPMPPVVTRSGLAEATVDWTEKMKGRVYVLELWATWCAGCIQAMPKMHEVYDRLHPRGFEIVSVSFDPDPSYVDKVRKTWPMPWQHAFPTGEEQQALWGTFGMQLPRSVLVGADGEILAVDPQWSKLEELLPSL